MNILFINTTDSGGGAATVCQALKTAAEAKGHMASLFAADIRNPVTDTRIIPRPFWRKALGFLLGTESLISSDWILRTPEFRSADIVHCHNLHGRYFNLSTLRKMSRLKPVVWTLHDEWAITPHCANTMQSETMRDGLFTCPSIDTPPRLLWDNTKRLARWKNAIYRSSKITLVTPSRWLKQRVEKTILGEQSVFHVPNGIDTTVFTRTSQQEARGALGLPEDKKIVLFLADDAVHNPWKGWEYSSGVMTAFANQEDTVFLSVGNHGEYSDGERVLYRGYVPDPATVALYYSAADAFLFSSVAENFPLAIIEAMSCGLPVVAFDVGGVSEAVVHTENGYISRYRDQKDLEAGLSWVLGLSAEERERMADASMQKARNAYDIQDMIEAYERLYTRLLHTA